jgi:putative peptidoglycan lipid II flippase
MSKRFTSTILGASIFISILMLVGRGFGFIREVVYAGYFGIGEQFDLYLVGAVFPLTLNTIIYYLGQNYFIPSYNKVLISNKSDAPKFLSQIFFIFVIGGILLSVFLIIFSDLIISFYLHLSDSAIKITASRIFIIFLITIPFFSGISILSSYLQAKLEYTYPAISRLFLNISIILLILLFSDDFGIYVIPFGFAFGILIQFIYLLYKTTRFGDLKLKLFRLDRSLLISTLKSSLILIVLIETVSQLYIIADRFFYTDIPSGGIASLNYAYNLFIFPIAIFTYAITTAIFPRISDAFVRNTDTELTKVISESISASLVIFTPITFLFVFYSEPIIKIVFERGNFTAEGTAMTAEVLRIYALSLILYSVYAILNKILYSAELIKQLLMITLTAIIIKIIFNFALVDSMHQTGLAMGTSISYVCFFVFSLLLVKKYVKLTTISNLLFEFLTNLLNGLLSYLTSTIIVFAFFEPSLSSEILSIIIFFGVFFLNLLVQRHPTVEIIKNMYRRLVLSV